MTTNFRAAHRTSAIGILAVLSIGVGALQAQAATRFVSANLATGANDGTSWANAFRGPGALTVGLAASVSGDDIWVAAGIYLPSTSGNRSASFALKTGVAIYGGFVGTESSLAQRNWATNVTTLSGDLAGNDGAGTTTDNSYHVVDGTGALASGVLDGFTVRGGKANLASGTKDRGAGLIATSGNPTIRRCIFTANAANLSGGACYVAPTGAAFSDCQFINNTAGQSGGGVETNAALTSFDRCHFRSNSAVRAGGLEVTGGGTCALTNCIFASNSASGNNGGGGIWIGDGTVTARNCTIYGNSSPLGSGGGVNNAGGTSTFGNCIMWANTGLGSGASAWQLQSTNGSTSTVTYCVMEGGISGSTNSAVNPLFVNPAAGDLSLQALSPSIDSGSNALVPAGTTTDYAGKPRFADMILVVDTGVGIAPFVDRGAYERNPPPNCPADINGDSVVDGFDLGTLLSQFNGPGTGDLNGDGVVDGSDLGAMLGAWGACPQG